MERRLRELVACHSTPGDEGEVRELLASWWTATGLEVTCHGAYALSAEVPSAAKAADAPVLLICAHMDSPGYAVDRLTVEGAEERPCLGLTTLGSPHFEGYSTDAVLKTRQGVSTGGCGGSAGMISVLRQTASWPRQTWRMATGSAFPQSSRGTRIS